jgi:multidrug efflux pump subunit AcrA (membrane-fusion protein)
MVVVLLGASGCGEQNASPERDVPTAQAERRDIREEIRLSGDVAPAFQVEIKPEVGGKLREAHASTGQVVKQGDLLFVIDDSDLQIERASAQVDIDGARVSVEKLAGNLGRARAGAQALVEILVNLTPASGPSASRRRTPSRPARATTRTCAGTDRRAPRGTR